METPKQLMPKLLLQVSARELQNSMVSPIEEGGQKKQGMPKIISSSVIQPYIIFSHRNSKIRPLDKNSCVGVSVVYLPKSCIRHHYHRVSAF